jgi:RimJ/RimL family protein N-acetyltransferase
MPVSWGHDDPQLAGVQARHDRAVSQGQQLYRDPASGYYVLTAAALRAKGGCCGNGCRHCPFELSEQRRAGRATLRPAGFFTERTVGRPWHVADAPALFELYGDPQVTRFIGAQTHADVDATRAVIGEILGRNGALAPGLGSFTTWSRVDGSVVGCALIKPIPGPDRAVLSDDVEIGWHVARRLWGQGYATEMGRGLVRHAFDELGLDRIIAVVEPPNGASQAVARKLGMVHQGRTVDYYGGIELELFTLQR